MIKHNIRRSVAFNVDRLLNFYVKVFLYIIKNISIQILFIIFLIKNIS
jgi:hypothetical protein